MKKGIRLFITAMVLSFVCLLPISVSAQESLVIRSADELESFASEVNSGNSFEGVTVYLEADITLSKTPDNVREWTAIGTEENPFKGNFDGNGHTISGIYIKTEAQYQGLFGVVSGAQIRNVYIENGQIQAADHAGAIAGFAKDKSVITSCHNVNTGIYTNNRSGGIVGWTDNSDVYNCSNTGYCYSDRCSAGIVGDVYSNGKIYNCENSGTINGKNLVGGIAGGTTSADIQNCLNVGMVESGYHIAGGAGSRKITNCFAYKNDEFNSNIGGDAYVFGDVCATFGEAVKVGEMSYTKVVDALNAYTSFMEAPVPMTAWSQYESFPYINRTNIKTWFGSTVSGWSKEEVESAYDHNLIPESLIGEDLTKPITRLEFAAVSVKAYESLAGTKALPATINPFEDCNDIEMLKAYNQGITVGVSANEFNPDGLLNREQAATMLTRVFKRATMPGWSMDKDNEFALSYTKATTFADDALISDWAKESVYFMNANGIILGVDGNKFAPKNVTSEEEANSYANATREQALIIATRMVKNLK